MLRRPILWYLRSALKVGLVAGLASIDVRYVPALLQARRWFLPFGHPTAPGYLRGWFVWASHRSGPAVLAAWHAAWGPHLNLLVAALQIPSIYIAIRILFWRRRPRDQVRAAAAATHGSARWRRPSELSQTLRTIDTERP